MTTSKPSRERRRGKQNEPIEKRDHCVSVRLNKTELEILDAKRGRFQRGEWLRVAFLDKLPPTVPDINIELYTKLNKTLGAIGAIIKTDRTLTGEQSKNINELIDHIKDFQKTIIRGAKK